MERGLVKGLKSWKYKVMWKKKKKKGCPKLRMLTTKRISTRLDCLRIITTTTTTTTTPTTATISSPRIINHKKKQYLLPPSISQLIASSRKRHKPNTQSSLTVAARALAKHAHRSSSSSTANNGFFGRSKGSEFQKNEHAERMVRRLIEEAVWINVHAFGGVDESRPVVEARVVEGYGARWSGVWRQSAFRVEDVCFRGFLEPNVEDGHENRWRH
mmetsp:Transcript_25127/g.54314  ORF Transcript_25127/g.54314 Transcript_25127/m.54314 type:complete len:215 (+) Transcript_25127:91-735(+)